MNEIGEKVMNRKIANRVLIGLFVCMAISLALPIFKGYWPGELVSGSFTVRGYEIVSIAPVFGSGVLLMIFISLVTLTTHIGFRKKCIILFPVNFANMILYIASTYHTRRWIYSTDAINVSEMYGAYIFCSLITLALILPFVIEQWSRPIKTYSDAEELCETMVDLGSELDGNDELGYGLFVDMLFWANEYTRLITMKAQPDIQTNKKLYEESGATERIEADIENALDTYLADLDVILKDHIHKRGIERYLPDESYKVKLAGYLSLYFFELKNEITKNQ